MKHIKIDYEPVQLNFYTMAIHIIALSREMLTNLDDEGYIYSLEINLETCICNKLF